MHLPSCPGLGILTFWPIGKYNRLLLAVSRTLSHWYIATILPPHPYPWICLGDRYYQSGKLGADWVFHLSGPRIVHLGKHGGASAKTAVTSSAIYRPAPSTRPIAATTQMAVAVVSPTMIPSPREFVPAPRKPIPITIHHKDGLMVRQAVRSHGSPLRLTWPLNFLTERVGSTASWETFANPSTCAISSATHIIDRGSLCC